MAEYIDRQALLKKYCKEQHKGDCKHCDWYGDSWCRGELFGVQIAEFPAADVVPVIHGRWIRLDACKGMENFKCSVCRYACYVPTCMYEPMSCYCPNCGAKMDGGDGV